MRTHVSQWEIGRLLPVIVAAQPEHPDHKPRGFWFEVDGGWREWCGSEAPEWISGQLLYELRLDPAVNLLQLRTEGEIENFHQEFAINDGRRFSGWQVDWRRVAEKWDGIEIAPYQWGLRLNWKGDGIGVSDWYYGWDCASGCLWTPRKSKLKLLETLPAAAESEAAARTS